MKQKHLLSVCLLGGPLISVSTFCQKAEEKPNIIIFIADDVSCNDIGCYGNNQVKTPNIDRLSEEGIKFTNFFLTASSSSPSRNSIITGRYPHNTGAAELHTEPPLDMISFPELLKQNGYHTVQAGKFHMGKYAHRGFDMINENGKLNGDGGEELWIQMLQERPPDKPFFMWFASYDAHRPWGSNEFSGVHDPLKLTPPFFLASGDRTKGDLASYYNEIARFDYYIGQIVRELESQKMLDNTVIIVMADNGRPFPHCKTRVNDRGMKTPFIIHWPSGIGREQRNCSSLISAVDIAPTVLELASVEAPDFIQGYSFMRVVNDPAKQFRNFVFAEHNWHDYEAHERMVRTNEFLYILNSRPLSPNMGPADAIGSPSFGELVDLKDKGRLSAVQADIFITPRPCEELYNCKSDPEQILNIASVMDYNKYLVELRQILKEWMVETGDDIPQNLTHDWYLRKPGNQRTENHGIRGDPLDKRFNATMNNNKGRF